MERRDSALSAGESLGPYAVKRVLGAGAFGVVYEALKQPLEKRVALKVLRGEMAVDPTLVARFLREAQAAASLKHPNIVEVDDAGVIEGVPFLAMEFLEGQSLADRIDNGGPLAIADALELMLPVCSAVAAVHEREIIHRDLKPDNIFLWQPLPGQLQPKLLDFGIAKLRTQTNERALTATGTMFGTPKYMPPEQWSNSKNTIPQSDQWALAVIVYECISGVTPYDADDIPALVLKMSTEPPRALRELVPAAPEQLEQVLTRALARDPQARFGSVREFARALLPFASEATRARWSSEFARGGDIDRAATLYGSLEGGPRPSRSVEHSPTLQRSATELSVREPPARSTGARVVGAALGGAAVVALALAVWGASRDVTPGRAATASPTAAIRTSIPLPPTRPRVPVANAQRDAGAAPPPLALPIAQGAPEPAVAAAPRPTRHRRHHRARSRRREEPASGSGAIPNL